MKRPDHVPAELVIDFNAFGSESIDELMEKVEEWRRLGPVVWTDHNGGHWVALSAGCVREILSDPAKFSSSEPRKGITLVEVERELHVPIEMDGEEHRQYRAILIPLFSPQRIQKLEASVRETARSFLADFTPRGSCDVVTDYARPLASSMFMRLVDWPIEDSELLQQLAELQLNGPPGATPEERAAAKREAGDKIAEYVKERIAERRAAPDDFNDMTTIIMNSKLSTGDPIPEEKLVPMLRLLMIAGLDTTQSVLSQSLAYLAERPKAQDYLRGHREEVPRIVEEFLRWSGAAMPNRTAVCEVEIGGVRIAKGDTVNCLLAAANRDSAEFDNPEMVAFTREVNRHVAFSVGPHRCIGASLARVVLAAALDEFHQAIETYSVTTAESHTGAVWGMNRLDLMVKPVALPA